MTKIKSRGRTATEDAKATFISDGNDQYTKALLENFDESTINYGQLVKERENGRVIGKTRTIVFGGLCEDAVLHNSVESFIGNHRKIFM